MKKIYPRGFTLIELLVAVSIVSIIGVASLSSFSSLMDSSSSESIENSISHTLTSLDLSVERHEITSYKTVFAKDSVGHTINHDFYKKTNPLALTFDFTTGSGNLSSEKSSSDTWFLDFFRDGQSDTTLGTRIYTSGFSFSYPEALIRGAYDIYAQEGGREQNSWSIHYYNQEGNYTTQESQAKLESIECSGTTYPSIAIENILGKKSITSGASILKNCHLTFDKNGKESVLTLK